METQRKDWRVIHRIDSQNKKNNSGTIINFIDVIEPTLSKKSINYGKVRIDFIEYYNKDSGNQNVMLSHYVDIADMLDICERMLMYYPMDKSYNIWTEYKGSARKESDKLPYDFISRTLKIDHNPYNGKSYIGVSFIHQGGRQSDTGAVMPIKDSESIKGSFSSSQDEFRKAALMIRAYIQAKLSATIPNL
ncbi:MAG: hypothetical protein SNJ71_05585 [Bacteroidales bacterium]